MWLARRRILKGAIAAALGASFSARSQLALPRVVIINRVAAFTDAFVAGLAERGWTAGRNIEFEAVSPTDETFAKELQRVLARRPSVLVLPGGPRIAAAARLTNSISIVGIDLESDPVAAGFAKTLGRPDGNISGVWLDLPELAGKNVELLRELVPGLASIGVLWDQAAAQAQFNALDAVARATKLELHSGPVHTAGELDPAIARLSGAGAKALVVLTSPLMFNERERIITSALKRRLPVASLLTAYPDAGALLAYGPSLPGMFRQSAGHVDRILRGAKPARIPIERPVKFELVINAGTAKRLGLVVPDSLRIRADRVIE